MIVSFSATTNQMRTCNGLNELITNTSPLLGTCSRDTSCNGVRCTNASHPAVGDSSITFLPCNLPQPAINVVIRAKSGLVLGNITSYRSGLSNLTVNAGGSRIHIATLGWTIQYNQAESSLQVQVCCTQL